jgi:DnaJ domain
MGDKGKGSPPSEAMMVMLAPDGYYAYLGIPKPIINAAAPSAASAAASSSGGSDGSAVDLELIKKNYRKLSVKHHPDKPGGDADTFRMLKRAQTVLSHAKLRQQYDILGLDLDDDDEMSNHQDEANGGGPTGTGEDGDHSTTSQGIVHEIASMALTSVLQVGVRTGALSSPPPPHQGRFSGLYNLGF